MSPSMSETSLLRGQGTVQKDLMFSKFCLVVLEICNCLKI